MKIKAVVAMMLLCILLCTGCREPIREGDVDGPIYTLQNGQLTVDDAVYVKSDWDFYSYSGDIVDEAIGVVDDRDNGYTRTQLYTRKDFPDRIFLIYAYEFDVGSGYVYSLYRRNNVGLPEFIFDDIDSVAWKQQGLISKENFGFNENTTLTRSRDVIRALFNTLSDDSLVINHEEWNDYEFFGHILCRNDDYPGLMYTLSVYYKDGSCCLYDKSRDRWVSIPYELIGEINGLNT